MLVGHTKTCTAVLLCVHAALTKLNAGQYATLREHHLLPPNLLELSAGNLTAAACLLPLKHLKDLTLQSIEYEAASAEQLQQLSSLTALTAVHLTYWTPADITDAAAAGWSALKLRSLHLAPGGDGCFARSTLLQLSHLTDLQVLSFNTCGLSGLCASWLAVGLGGLRQLRSLSLKGVYWRDPEADAADSHELASLLRVLAAMRQRGMPHLTHLSLESSTWAGQQQRHCHRCAAYGGCS